MALLAIPKNAAVYDQNHEVGVDVEEIGERMGSKKFQRKKNLSLLTVMEVMKACYLPSMDGKGGSI